jgi:hypothetical protein
MDVIFRRTGQRRYAVVVERPGQPTQVMNPAPGFDEHIPHDLVHYVVEAELRLSGGVFGRAAQGGGDFYFAEPAAAPRERARARRKQQKRERALSRDDASHEMQASERLAYLSDIAWRRRHGQRPSPAHWQTTEVLSAEDSARVERVVRQLERVAPAWHALPAQGELAFTWPSLQARPR